MLRVSEPGALNYYTLFRLIPLTLFISRNQTLIYLPLSGSLDILLYNPMASTPDLVFFLLMSQTPVAASSSSSSRTYSSVSFLPPLFLCLAIYTSDYVEVNISLNNSSSFSFLNVYVPPIRSFPKDSRINFFSFYILPSYVEAEAVDFSRFRFRFHRKSTASTEKVPLPLPASASTSTSLVETCIYTICMYVYSTQSTIKILFLEMGLKLMKT